MTNVVINVEYESTESIEEGFYLIEDPYLSGNCVGLIKNVRDSNNKEHNLFKIIIYLREGVSYIGYDMLDDVNIIILSKIDTVTFS